MKNRRPTPTRTPLVIALTLLFAGPAEAQESSRLYHWSSYELDMYRVYSRLDDEEPQLNLAATMLRIIQESDKAGRKPPPGIVAEYGYVLFQRGEYFAAIDQFRREATTWPESEKLMDLMIRRAQAEAGS